MDYFDFYEIKASSSRKSDLKSFVQEGKTLTNTCEFVNYGSKRYPRYTYHVTLGFVDMSKSAKEAVQHVIDAAKKQAPKATISAKYHAR